MAEIFDIACRRCIGLNEIVPTLGDIVAHDVGPYYADAPISFEEGLRRTVEDVVAQASAGSLAP